MALDHVTLCLKTWLLPTAHPPAGGLPQTPAKPTFTATLTGLTNSAAASPLQPCLGIGSLENKQHPQALGRLCSFHTSPISQELATSHCFWKLSGTIPPEATCAPELWWPQCLHHAWYLILMLHYYLAFMHISYFCM